MKVMKFGGSTIKNPKMMKKVGDIIKKDKSKKAVVVSALLRQTNEIREYLRKIRTEKKEIEAFIQNIRHKHEHMAEKAIPDEDILAIEIKMDQILSVDLCQDAGQSDGEFQP